MEINTRLSTKDYFSASAFGYISRNANFIKTFLFFAAAAIIYEIIGRLGIVKFYPIISLIAVSYFVFILVALGNMGFKVIKYKKQKDSLIDKEINYKFSEKYIEVSIPHLNEKKKFGAEQVIFCYEKNDIFMMYVNATDTFLIPKSHLNKEQIIYLRDFFVSHLKTNFMSKSFDQANKGIGFQNRKGFNIFK